MFADTPDALMIDIFGGSSPDIVSGKRTCEIFVDLAAAPVRWAKTAK